MANSAPPSERPQAIVAPDGASRVAARLAALKIAKARYAALRKIHRTIAADFAQLDEEKAARLVKRALGNVTVWEHGGGGQSLLCARVAPNPPGPGKQHPKDAERS